MFGEVSEQLKHFIFTNFVPAAGDVVQSYIEQFVANSSKMTAVGGPVGPVRGSAGRAGR